MNHSLSTLKHYPYQLSAHKNMREFFASYIRWILEHNDDKEISTAMLIEMATGSGKTFTVGSFIDYLYQLRERYARLYKKSHEQLPRIKTLVLNDRIFLINQLKQDFFFWDPTQSKSPILSDQFIDWISTKLYHSKTKNDDTSSEEETIVEETKSTSQKNWDLFVFSTFQTALGDKWPDDDWFTIIIIDEAHNLSWESYYQAFQKYYKPLADGTMPFVFLMSATPNKELLQLSGDAIVHYWLAEYLADDYSPTVSYNLVVNSTITPEQIDELNQEIFRIQAIENLNEKK